MKKLLIYVTILLVTLITHAKEKKSDVTKVFLAVTEKGFEPNKIDVPPGKKISLSITRKTNETCATSIQIPSRQIKKELPLNEPVTIDLGVLAKGEIRFGCGMNMMESGIIYVK